MGTGVPRLLRESASRKGRRARLPLGRLALAIAPLAVLLSVVMSAPASASSVSSVMAAANPPNAVASANYTINYTPSVDQTIDGTITVTAAPGTNFAACTSSCANYSLLQVSNTEAISSVTLENGSGSTTDNEFVITLGLTTLYSGNPVSILAPGTNHSTSGTYIMSVSTSAESTPASKDYIIGTPSPALGQGAIPNGGVNSLGADDTPAYLQSIFGAQTDTNSTIGLDYIPSSSWAQIDGSVSGDASASGSLSYLSVYDTPGYQLELGVPILPSQGGTYTLETGANPNNNQNYDQYWAIFAQTLCLEGLGNTWLRLGYEFDNGSGNAWYTGNSTTGDDDLQYFGEYFAQIASTMQSEESSLENQQPNACPSATQGFKFVWNPTGLAFLGSKDTDFSGGMPLSSLEQAWPGGYGDTQYVNYVGIDVFDAQPPNESYTEAENWSDNISNQLRGAQSFETAEGVSGIPLAFPEWGLDAPNQSGEPGGMGDDPDFVDGMYCFMVNNNVAFETYDNVSGSGWASQITPGGGFPSSLIRYQDDFGQGDTSECSG
jgi:hypothetical protein